MKRIYLIILLCLGMSPLYAQNLAGPIFAIEASPTDHSTKVVSWPSDSDTITTLLRLGAWQPFQGQAAFNPYDQQFHLIGVGLDGTPAGIWLDVKAKKLLARYPVEGSCIGLQFDFRQRIWWALQQRPQQAGYSIVQWEDAAWKVRHDLPQLQRISPQSITFDHSRGLYVFVGQDTAGTRRLYRIDTNKGQVLDESPVEDFIFEGLQVDLSDDKLYGIARKRSNVSQYFFVEINPSTAFPTIIIPFVGVERLASHTATFDQSRGIYAVVTRRANEPWELQEIDVFEGLTVRRRTVSSVMEACFIDNARFGESQYND